ncbi:von Willebrand factor C and EGF domain-containing protein-like [Pristis pectinata]|uniref:von Willebrand factor C and EGF domain-containing protein-like n=1 Tax=Pristis pectinata TaxID=685728 RepID=UPI00223DE856|nr:von Willebrand factor C and EGF domain-containing protein-like [Pristis pectinata]
MGAVKGKNSAKGRSLQCPGVCGEKRSPAAQGKLIIGGRRTISWSRSSTERSSLASSHGLAMSGLNTPCVLLCMLLCMLRADGRGYPGRKRGVPKHYSTAMQRYRHGPHMCQSRYANGCCLGWSPTLGSGLCVIPVCSFGCGNGYCVAPNLCFCRGGQQGISCSGLSAWCGEYGCDMSCNHGGCEEISRVCPVGFTVIETSIGISCKDINECSTASCKGQCVNKEGGFVCDCGAGMQLSPDKHSCVDIDECAGNRSPCQQRCQNVIGSFKCSCRPGYYLHNNGHLCTDVNECRWVGESRVCHHSCHNTFGSYLCSCRAGFQLQADRKTCEDIDECEANGHTLCEHKCINTIGSFKCTCPLGYEVLIDGQMCIDVNECEKSNCSHHCVNTLGSFQCLCPRGYTQHPNGHNCQGLLSFALDNNECATSRNGHCAHNCINTAGSYYCSCRPGYRLHFDRHSCIYIDECLSSPCSHHCLNTEGSFYCTCPDGFYLSVNNTCTEHLLAPVPVMESLKQPLPAAILATPWTPLTSCWYNETLQQDGSTWTVSDCVECTCREGEVLCQLVVCKTSCSHQVLEEGQCCGTCDKCLYEGRIVDHEDVFSPSNDNCTLCACISGNVKCITPECPPVACEKPVLLDCCPTCPAECIDHGIVYPHGAEFTRPGIDCINCACLNGEVECYYRPCPVLECAREEWFLEPNQCCFTCRQDKIVKGCFIDDNGIEFPVGQIWSPGDPCEVCVCQADGSIVCKRTECLETCAHPILVPGQCCPDCSAGCAYGGMIYKNNETFPSAADSCLTCICLSGSAACSPVECKVSCTYPFHSEGECCPLCMDCNYEGRKVTNGQTFQPEHRPCHYCICQLGEVSCEVRKCEPPSCDHPHSVPGDCCPTCSVCLYDGQILEDGGYYISAADPCVVCLCMKGNVECDWKGDSCTELECERPLRHVPGTCCPVCPDLSMASPPTERSGLHPPITDNTLPEIPAPTESYQSPRRATAQPPTSDTEVGLISLSPLSSTMSKKYNLNQIVPWSLKRKLGQELNTSPKGQRIITTKQPMAMEVDTSSDGAPWGISTLQVVLPPPATFKATSADSEKIKDEIVQEGLSCLDEDGVVFSHGQSVPREDPCAKCLCLQSTILCKSQKEQCSPLLCDLMQQKTPDGQCCPVCVDSHCVVRSQQVHIENASSDDYYRVTEVGEVLGENSLLVM